MLQGAVLSFGLFTNYDEVQVIVASAVARQAVHMNHICKKVQFTPVEGEISVFERIYRKKNNINNLNTLVSSHMMPTLL